MLQLHCTAIHPHGYDYHMLVWIKLDKLHKVIKKDLNRGALWLCYFHATDINDSDIFEMLTSMTLGD